MSIKANAIKCVNIYRGLQPYGREIHERVKNSVYRMEHIDDFLKFLAIKAVYGNNYGTDFSPGYISDRIWHTILLDTRLYAKLERVCGRRIHHHPERANDPKDIILRRQLLTKYAMEKHFGHKWLIGTFQQFCKQRGKDIIQALQSEPRLGC